MPLSIDRLVAAVKVCMSTGSNNHMNHVQSHPDFIKFHLKVDKDEYDKLVEYNKVLNFIDEQFFNSRVSIRYSYHQKHTFDRLLDDMKPKTFFS